MTEETRNDETGQVLIPMIVDRKSFEETGYIVGVDRSKIRKWKIGDRTVDVVFVPGTQEQYRSLMADYSREFKTEDRDRRCAVSGQDGKLIRCPDERKCEGCPYNLARENYGTATFSDLATEDENGEITEFNPEAPETFDSAERYMRILEDLINHVTEIDPSLGRMIQLLHDGKSRREVAEEMGLPKSTVIDQVAKLKKITEQFLDDLAY